MDSLLRLGVEFKSIAATRETLGYARTAEEHFDSQVAESSGLRCKREISGLRIARVGALDVVRFVSRHHLIAADAVGDCAHDGPLGCRDLPPAFGLLAGQLDGASAAEVRLELRVLDEDAAPHNFT